MDPITIAALAAMVAGAGLQYKASTDAQKRQREEIARSLAAQDALQKQAEQKALATADTYNPGDRIAEQAQIATDIEQSLIAPVSESQAIRAQQTTTQGDTSGDYQVAKAASDVQTMKQAEQLARLLGKTTSASRLRMGEGIRLMDAGQAIDQLNSFSRGRQGADNVAVQQAGLLDPGKVFAGQLLQAAGTAGMMYTPTPAGANYGLSAPSATGLKASAGEGFKLASATGGPGLKLTSGAGLSGFRTPNSFISAFPAY